MKPQTHKLLSPLFLTSLFLLLLNDWVLKATFHNEFTGKLSDVAGLFTFPFFFAVFFPKRVKAIYLFTFFFFLYWKSPLSQGLIDFWNGLAILPMQRVVDYSDYETFLVVPFSYQYFKKNSYHFSIPKFALLNYMIILISLLTFTATSISTSVFQKSIKEEYAIEKRSYEVQGSKQEVINRLLHQKGTFQNTILRYTLLYNKDDSIIRNYSASTFMKEDSTLQVFYFIKTKEWIEYFQGIAQVSLDSINTKRTRLTLHSIDTLNRIFYRRNPYLHPILAPFVGRGKKFKSKFRKEFEKDTIINFQVALKAFEDNVIGVLNAPHELDSLLIVSEYLRKNNKGKKLIQTLKIQSEKYKLLHNLYSDTTRHFLPLYEIPLIYMYMGKYIEAEQSALKAEKDALSTLKVAYQNKDLVKYKIKSYQLEGKLLAYLPFNTLAYAQLMQGKLKEAKQNIRQAKRYYRENVYTQFNQAVYYTEKEKYQKSLEIFEALASKPEKNLHFYFHYGKTLYILGQKQKAESIWKKVEDTFEKQMVKEFKN